MIIQIWAWRWHAMALVSSFFVSGFANRLKARQAKAKFQWMKATQSLMFQRWTESKFVLWAWVMSPFSGLSCVFLCHLYIICIYIWYMIHKYYWPILIDYMFKWCMCFHDVSCADTQRFTAGPNFGWCIPPGEAPLSQGLQPSLLTLSSLTALATFILVYMINMNIIQI